MIRDAYSPSLTSRLFVYVLFLIVIFQGVVCGIIELPDPPSVALVSEGLPYDLPKIDPDDHNQNEHKNAYKYSPNITNIETVEDYDPDYPYEQILQLVNETRALLLSSNITEKKKLKFDPSLYESYLKGEVSDSTLDFPESNDLPAYAGQLIPKFDCRKEILNRLPKRMRSINGEEHYIVNVGRSFTQSFGTIRCRSPGKYCKDPGTWPEYYMYTCDQNLGKKVRLFSVPVNRRLAVSEQDMHDFQVADGCVCRMVRRSR